MLGKVTVTIEKTFDRLAEVTSALSKMAKTSVLVGVPEQKGNRDEGEGINNATLAYIHENGSDRAHIPARKFMEPGIEKAKDAINAHLKAASKAAWRGDASGMTRSHNKAGQVAANSIRAMFTNNKWAPLKDSTLDRRPKAKAGENGKLIKQKTRRERGATNPLNDTGQLKKSITYVVKGD